MKWKLTVIRNLWWTYVCCFWCAGSIKTNWCMHYQGVFLHEYMVSQKYYKKACMFFSPTNKFIKSTSFSYIFEEGSTSFLCTFVLFLYIYFSKCVYKKYFLLFEPFAWMCRKLTSYIHICINGSKCIRNAPTLWPRMFRSLKNFNFTLWSKLCFLHKVWNLRKHASYTCRNETNVA